MKLISQLLILAIFFCSCKENTAPPSEEFTQKWYTGKAEISSYDLQQARYGELRNGEAALIFVTEDFSTEKLVKLDEPEKTNDKLRVLKMNSNFVIADHYRLIIDSSFFFAILQF